MDPTRLDSSGPGRIRGHLGKRGFRDDPDDEDGGPATPEPGEWSGYSGDQRTRKPAPTR